jgi:CRP-like cAMP-binding protein
MEKQYQESILEQNLRILRRIPAFYQLDYDAICLFAMVADRRKYTRDEIIFSKGDFLSTAFIIIQGEVELFLGSRQEKNSLERLGPGDFFGYMALLAKIQFNVSACALSHCELLTLDRNNFRKVMVQFHKSGILIVEKLIQARMNRMDFHMDLLMKA